MASSLLALLDDIASLLDNVSALTKVATQKTAGVLGDDLALNAQQVAGLEAHRELPVVWAVAKGSLQNKAILVPSALATSTFAPWAVIPLLMIGGLYLCYEGFEKLAHSVLHARRADRARHVKLVRAGPRLCEGPFSIEKTKIKGAVRTDFVLSAEIIVITLGTVAAAPIATRAAVVVCVAILMTVGVYGLVAGIVKLDDAGLYLSRSGGDTALARIQRRIGVSILAAAPLLMKGLSIAGVVAMFLVGGGILVHGIPALGAWNKELTENIAARHGIGGLLPLAIPLLLDATIGTVAGALMLAIARGVHHVMRS
jgi:predicted DNA repair protein MutK